MIKKPWHIGNTTVRNPYRLRDALTVLLHSEFHGNLMGKENESGFARLLHEKGILNAERINQDDARDFSDLGRKWRSALAQIGFVAHQKGLDSRFSDFIKQYPQFPKKPYELTPNGKNLIRANSIPAQQECFLRSLVAYRIPSFIETLYHFEQFSPLRHILTILVHFEKEKIDPIINFWEMAVLQTTIPSDGYGLILKRILTIRVERQNSDNKKRFDRELLFHTAGEDATKGSTLKDYADLNLRYLKATGLFQSSGRGIRILPEKHTLVEKIIGDRFAAFTEEEYLKILWIGAALPTDNINTAKTVIQSLAENIRKTGNDVAPIDFENKTISDISALRHDLEDQLNRIKELDFSKNQAAYWEEIFCYMNALKKPGKKIPFQGEEIFVPAGEAPAYFEWIIWRAFLAINSLVNTPWDSRRFKIDQDFLPIGTAPGGGPDLIFEFHDFVLVVEVTLTTSSRQEAAEGEPVRRHVAHIAEQYENTGKRVYGLFMALTIDSNTAETFKIGTWYKSDDTKLPLQIIPMRLDDFSELFNTSFKSGGFPPQLIRELITECRALTNIDAPAWKIQIIKEVKRLINQIAIKNH